jgi:hypothetical protein
MSKKYNFRQYAGFILGVTIAALSDYYKNT